MITNTDITKLKEVFATKQDLADMGTELKATFATKKELAELRADMNVGFGEVQDKMDTMAAGIARIENAVDKFSGITEELRSENAAGHMHLSRHDRQINALARGTKISIPEWVPE